MAIFTWLPLLLALAAIGYTLHATFVVRRFACAPQPPLVAPEPITLLKPLHGLEPRLLENLATFLTQDWSASIQLVAGTNRTDDPALAIARALPGDVAIRAPARALGSNGKISNVTNLLPAAKHDLLVLSDSDMAVPSDYLSRVAATLNQPGVGAVTCLYHGRGDEGSWSRFAAAAIDWQFAPSVMMSLALGIEHPCMGSTIALRRETLDRIGGFEAFADLLADDYEIGVIVRRLGLKVEVVPGLLITHACVEDSLAAVWRHELRWSRTLRAVSGHAHLGSLLTHPLPLALLATLFHPLAAAAIAAALLTRALLAHRMDRLTGAPSLPLALLPARDLFSFVVFLASFAARSVDWRGERLRMRANGRISGGLEFP